MYVDDRMIIQRHRQDITAAASTRLVRALRGSARARRRQASADEHLQRALGR
jgi:hypothetical protein